MEIEQILKISSLISSFGLIFFAWNKFQSGFEKYTFSIMQVLFLLPMVMNFDDSAADTWARHIVFYFGQVMLFYFLNEFISNSEKIQQHSSDKSISLTVIPLAIASDTPILRWFHYITEQGIEHFLVLPLLFLTVTMVRLRISNITSSERKSFINWTVTGATVFSTIHISEFLIESQKIIPFIQESLLEYMEHGIFIAGIICFSLAVSKLSGKPVQKDENKI